MWFQWIRADIHSALESHVKPQSGTPTTDFHKSENLVAGGNDQELPVRQICVLQRFQ